MSIRNQERGGWRAEGFWRVTPKGGFTKRMVQPKLISYHTIRVWGTGIHHVGLIQSTKAPKSDLETDGAAACLLVEDVAQTLLVLLGAKLCSRSAVQESVKRCLPQLAEGLRGTVCHTQARCEREVPASLSTDITRQ